MSDVPDTCTSQYLHVSMSTKILMLTMRKYTFVIAVVVVSFFAASCGNAQVAKTDTPAPVTQSTPSKKFTAADIAKLKWIEGTWRGMDGDKPF